MSTKHPQRIIATFDLGALVLAVASFVAYFATRDVRICVFLALSAILIFLDAEFFHGNNLKNYWEEIAKNGRAPSYDRDWNSWSLPRRLLHMVGFVAIAAFVVFFSTEMITWARAMATDISVLIGFVFTLAIVDGLGAAFIWIVFTRITLPKRIKEPRESQPT